MTFRLVESSESLVKLAMGRCCSWVCSWFLIWKRRWESARTTMCLSCAKRLCSLEDWDGGDAREDADGRKCAHCLITALEEGGKEGSPNAGTRRHSKKGRRECCGCRGQVGNDEHLQAACHLTLSSQRREGAAEGRHHLLPSPAHTPKRLSGSQSSLPARCMYPCPMSMCSAEKIAQLTIPELKQVWTEEK